MSYEAEVRHASFHDDGPMGDCVPCQTPTVILDIDGEKRGRVMSEFRIGGAIRGPRNWGTAVMIVLEIAILIAVLVREV